MTRILALDTSSDQCSVCILQNGHSILKQQSAARQHAQLLMPMIREVLAEAAVQIRDLDALAFGAGPGSFTGLRIAAGVVQGLAYGADLPVVRVSTLAAMARQSALIHPSERVLSCIDARMDQVYWACFDTSAISGPMATEVVPLLEGAEQVSDPGDLLLSSSALKETLTVAGSGLAYLANFPDALRSNIGHQDAEICANAGDIAAIARVLFADGQAVSAEQALPVYLRNEVAWKKLPGR